jgi:predicted transposase/invertase (TIGR01784 family)
VVFQRIFGNPENEEILISFLNSLLKGTESEKIEQVEYVDTKLNNIDVADDKIGVLDVRVTTDKGTHINIEIQLINKYNMINRTLFYWSRLYSGQLKRGAGYKDLNRTITINILNFEYIVSEKYHNIYHLYEDELQTKLTDLLEIQFVELPKFLRRQPKIDNSLNGWLAFLINPNREGIDMAEPVIKKAITVLDMLSRDPETVRLAELRMKKILDERSMLEGAKEEGKIEGKIEGIIEGKMEGKIEAKEETALNLLKMGIDEEITAEATGLDIEKIREIRSKL